MEHYRMSASFMSICKRTCDSTDTQLESIVPQFCANPDEDYTQAHIDYAPTHHIYTPAPSDAVEAPGCARKPAQEAFRAIVNAKSCANACGTTLLDGYLTIAREGVLIGSYMY